ncbi:knotted carbamoyltransferase YgeW, partial [bacterium]|nr:knotted carbamoyltransferase YgeW [bacterium]
VARRNAAASGGSFTAGHSMEEAFRDADVVYPKSWAPYTVMERRTGLLKRNDRPGLVELEKECLGNNAKFTSWECDAKKMALTKNGKALYMHCLPADITDVSCKQGEVAKGVFEQHRLATYREAGFKPFVIAAMILMAKFDDPAKALAAIARKGGKRLRY